MSESSTTIRLNRFLSQCGVSSRRKADELIEEGRVSVNGHIIKKLGVQIDPLKDHVKVGSKMIRPTAEPMVIAFNKPPRVLTTMSDPEGRPTVADYFTKFKVRLFPVGRLDWDSEGLLIMTNDGELSQKILHPKHEVPKTYLCKVLGKPTAEKLRKLRDGISIIGGKVNAEKVEVLPNRGTDKYTWIKVVITEGRNRQIRRMFEKIDSDVIKLQRVAIGGLRIGTLRKGEHKILNNLDVKKIFKTHFESAVEEES